MEQKQLQENKEEVKSSEEFKSSDENEDKVDSNALEGENSEEEEEHLLQNKRNREELCLSCGANDLEDYNFTNLESIFEYLLDNADKKLQYEFNEAVKRSNPNFSGFCRNCFMQKFIYNSLKAFEKEDEVKKKIEISNEENSLKTLFINFSVIITKKIEEISDKFYRDSIETEQLMNKTALQLMTLQKKQFQKFNEDMNRCKALMHKDRENFDNFKELIKSLTGNATRESNFFSQENLNYLNKFLKDLQDKISENENMGEDDKGGINNSPSDRLKNLQKEREKIINSNIGVIPNSTGTKHNRALLNQLNLQPPFLTNLQNEVNKNNLNNNQNNIKENEPKAEQANEAEPNKKKPKIYFKPEPKFGDLNDNKIKSNTTGNNLIPPSIQTGKMNINQTALNQLKLQQQQYQIQLNQKDLLNHIAMQMPGINQFNLKNANDFNVQNYQNLFKTTQTQLPNQNALPANLQIPQINSLNSLNAQNFGMQQPNFNFDSSFNQKDQIENMLGNPYQLMDKSPLYLQNLQQSNLYSNQLLLEQQQNFLGKMGLNNMGLKSIKPTLNQQLMFQRAMNQSNPITQTTDLTDPNNASNAGINLGVNPIDQMLENSKSKTITNLEIKNDFKEEKK